MPPPLASWEEYARALRWAVDAGAMPSPNAWWWELRPNVRFGTLEIRVPDAQTTVGEVAAVAAFAHCLVARLCERFDGDEPLPAGATWRIEENRWLAARDGVEGELADLASAAIRPTRERLEELIAELRPHGRRLGCGGELELARARWPARAGRSGSGGSLACAASTASPSGSRTAGSAAEPPA